MFYSMFSHLRYTLLSALRLADRFREAGTAHQTSEAQVAQVQAQLDRALRELEARGDNIKWLETQVAWEGGDNMCEVWMS